MSQFKNLKLWAGPAGFHHIVDTRTGFSLHYPVQKDKRTDDALNQEVFDFMSNVPPPEENK